ncbi:MAG TPA: signal peptidase I [Tepidisphaeraceae bacterium]|nr:signal peptidase I [Tepidisphaeraceae bacterium]
MRLPQRLRRFARETVLPVALTVLVLCSFRSAVADWNVVPTGSMNPSIVEGDRIFVNKLAYGLKVPFTQWHLAHWSGPQRGEIVVFNSPADGTRYVKRVVGLPGDTVALVRNQLFINGQPMTYAPLDPSVTRRLSPRDLSRNAYASEMIGGRPHPVMSTPALPARRDFGPVTVPADRYFVLGDNRDNSADSRYIGMVPRDNILGRSSSVVISLDPETHRPRWERTIKALQ